MNIRTLFNQRVAAAFLQAGIPPGTNTQILHTSRSEFGDYQVNGVMSAAKSLRIAPRTLAQNVVDALQLDDLASKIEIAGPGFINITLNSVWLGQQLSTALHAAHLGVERVRQPQTIVVDYSSPNLAKEMHVGHLRSTIIGDAVVRVLEFLGHRVLRQNHVGDWGTQFGMLIAYIERQRATDESQLTLALDDLEGFYRNAKQAFDADSAFADTARAYVVKLQQGDTQCLALWRHFIDVSMSHCERIYERLGVTLRRGDVHAESAYNIELPQIIDALRNQGLLRESEGAQCVFLDEFSGKEGTPLPAIVQKSDGGYLYTTTDLAAVRYRAQTLGAQRILYFVDARQNLHLKQVFAIARRAGFISASCTLEHHPFGTMMGEDGKPFKTRSGGTVKLVELLDEAEQRAYRSVTEKNPDLSEGERRTIARTVGIAAVKYADLSKNRINDYLFNWDQMLALEGNTAPYLLYAYTRIASIFRKGELSDTHLTGQIAINEPAERDLALVLARFSETVETVATDCYPNLLGNYLYQLAGVFMQFYENCPVLKAEDPTRSSRLLLCRLTAAVLKCGLELLGIETIEQM